MVQAPPLLDPLLVAKLATMELRARTVVEGALAGRHQSAHRGHSLEFVGHRAYTPGDEWRRLDWKVFAKTDRWVVREHEEESNLRAVLFLDVSRSMSFASPGRLPKIRYASILLAALGYLLTHRRESVGLGFLGRSLLGFVPPRAGAGHLSHLLDSLETVSAEGPTDLRAALEEAGPRLPRRSLAVIASDFLADPEGVLAAVKTLLSRKHEAVALQVLDPAERDFPFEGDFLVEDLESGETLRINADEAGPRYQQLMAARLEKLARGFTSLGVDAQLFTTDTPLDAGLSLFLQRRLER